MTPDSKDVEAGHLGAVARFSDRAVALVESLRERNRIRLVLVDANPLAALEPIHGRERHDALLAGLAETLLSLRGDVLGSQDEVVVAGPGAEELLVFLIEPADGSHPHVGATGSAALEVAADKVRRLIEGELLRRGARLEGGQASVRVGFASTLYSPLVDPVRALRRLVRAARRVAHEQDELDRERCRGRIEEVILQGAISPVYQPIVDLRTGQVFGYEALARGPQGEELESPRELYLQAERGGVLAELDLACRRRALASARGMQPGRKLFMNLLPSGVNDPGFHGEALDRMLEAAGLRARDIVLEITEHRAIGDRERFLSSLEAYRRAGVHIALDDVGSGYANLDALLLVRPEFLKLDGAIVRRIHLDPVRRDMARAMTRVARSIGARVVAEGIEREAELEVVRSLGIEYGQGFLLARPGPPFPEVAPLPAL